MKLHPRNTQKARYTQRDRDRDMGERETEACSVACTFESDNCKLCKIINFKLTICRPHRARLFTECALCFSLSIYLYLSLSPSLSSCVCVPRWLSRWSPTYNSSGSSSSGCSCRRSSSMPRSDAGSFMHCTKLATPGCAHTHTHTITETHTHTCIHSYI